jgi:hypothetical protein
MRGKAQALMAIDLPDRRAGRDAIHESGTNTRMTARPIRVFVCSFVDDHTGLDACGGLP